MDENEEGVSLEESLKILEMENTKERRNIAIALYDFRAEEKGQVSIIKK